VSRHHIIPAEPADAATLSQVIAAAFHHLAPSQWLVEDPTARARILPQVFRIFTDHAIAHGSADTTPSRTAVALWLPVPRDGPHLPSDYNTRLADATGAWIHHFVVFDAELDRHHPTGTAHHHLAMLAVHPHHQGQGIGTALLRTHHRLLDEAGIPAYLEASSQRSRALYTRHGYTGHGPAVHLPDGPLLCPMWRPPAATHQQPGQ
jgi:GNAT superfamily N-acetyltransferase